MKAQNKGLSSEQLILWGGGCRGGSLAGDHWGCPRGGCSVGALGHSPSLSPSGRARFCGSVGQGCWGAFRRCFLW